MQGQAAAYPVNTYAHALKAPVAEAAASLCKADALWMDETHALPKYAILDFIGEQCAAVVTTDRYAGYAFIDPERRQVCWAECGLQAS